MLPVAGKKIERVLYDKMYEFFTENNLISPNQSGFKPGDSCINLFLSMTHEIYKSFKTFQKDLIRYGTRILYKL